MPESKRTSYRKSQGISLRHQPHGNSDSGVGSSSDRDSYGSNPDRNFAAQDFYEQYSNLAALRQAYDSVISENEKLKIKNNALLADIERLHKENRQSESGYRALAERNTLLEEERSSHGEIVRTLREDCARLQASYQDVCSRLEDAPVSPTMSGGNGSDRSSKTKLHRSASKSRGKENSRDKTKRHGHDDKSTSTSTSSRRRRESTYVEPWGPAGVRPTVVDPELPQPRPRSYSISTSRQQLPVFSTIPRTLHTYESAVDDGYYEDGNYVAHDLPIRRRR